MPSDEIFFPFRDAPEHRWLYRMIGWRPTLDGVRVHPDGLISIALGKRILQTEAHNINAVDLVENLLWPMTIGVRRVPFGGRITFGTDGGSGMQLRFRTSVHAATGPMRHNSAVITIERPTELLPAILAARRSGPQN